MTSETERCKAFHQLHASGCFVIPNPWDVGSARALARLGFAALATTSSGSAWSLGRPDNGLSLDQALAHIRTLVENVNVPVSADFEGGFATAPAAVAANVTRATATGIAGLSIEDSTGDPSDPLFDFALAVERIQAARHAIDESGTGLLLTARSEGFIVGRPGSVGNDPAARRVRGSRSRLPVRARNPHAARHRRGRRRGIAQASERSGRQRLCDRRGAPGDGGARISVGGALARTAWTGFLQAAREIAERGTFATLGRAVSFDEMNQLFRTDT